MNYFSERTQREQVLIVGMLILVAALALWQLGIKPVVNNKARAEQSLSSAKRDIAIVRNGLPKLGQARALAQDSNQTPFDRPALIETSRAAEIAISRVQPGADNSLQVWFEDAPVLSVYSFMSNLSAQYEVSFERVQITRRDNGLVSAQFTLKPQS